MLENRERIPAGPDSSPGGSGAKERVSSGSESHETETGEETRAGTGEGPVKNQYKMIPAKLNWSQKSMEDKVVGLEESLNTKKERILEREIAIEELDKEIKKIREEIESNKKRHLKDAKRLNEVKMSFRDIMHKMMAVVSEVSVYQTRVVNLERLKQEKTLRLRTVEAKMSAIYHRRMDEEIEEIPSKMSGRRRVNAKSRFRGCRTRRRRAGSWRRRRGRRASCR